jgi:hypothetical protein
MTVQSDGQIGFKKESTFGTAVTVDTFLTDATEEDLNWIPTFAQGTGMRVGKRVARSDRRVLVKQEVGGSFTVQPTAKGLGKLIEAALGGTGTSTLISGSSYQQLFIPTTTDYLSSYTIQKGVPPLGGGSILPHTFKGMVCSGFEFSAGNASIPSLKFNWVGKSYDTSTTLATASYVTGNELYSFIHASLTIGGAVTVPTTTALATGGTAATNIREFNLTYENTLDSDGFNFGAAGARSRKPAVGAGVITGNFVAEFDAVTIRDLFLNQTDTAITFRLQTTTAISGSNYPTLEFTIPVARLNGEIPKAVTEGVVTISCDFDGLDGGVAAAPLYVAIVTAETAI